MRASRDVLPAPGGPSRTSTGASWDGGPLDVARLVNDRRIEPDDAADLRLTDAGQYRPRVLQVPTWPMDTPTRKVAQSELPSAALRDVVDHLGKGCDEDGFVPQPDPAFAERLEEFAAAS